MTEVSTWSSNIFFSGHVSRVKIETAGTRYGKKFKLSTVMSWCIYPKVNDFDFKYLYDYISIYMIWDTFICTILFGLLEFSKITLFKDLLGKIIEVKVAENGFFCTFPLNKVLLYDYKWPNMIVQINGLHVFYSDVVINI